MECDISDKNILTQLVNEIKPDYVYHMAAQSLVIPSWLHTEDTFKVNMFGTLYLLEAIRNQNIDSTIVIACSSSEYGITYRHELPIKENNEFRPTSPYGISKVGTDLLAFLYWKIYNTKIIRIRPFNITGPRKLFDATSEFARGIAEIEKGNKLYLQVGNLETVRDILDINDAIKAIWLLSQSGVPGEVYNICSGIGYKITDILDQLISMSTSKIDIRKDANRLRPMDESVYIGDNSKLCSLGWQPEVPIIQTLKNTLEYWRANV